MELQRGASRDRQQCCGIDVSASRGVWRRGFGLPDWTQDGVCTRPARGDEPSEEHQLVATSVTALCGSGWPSSRLCDSSASCGDGVCSGKESAEDCDSDCDPPSCGDGLCELSERSSCAEDCEVFSRVPVEWRGDPQDYVEDGEDVEGVDDGPAESASASHREGCSFGAHRGPLKSESLLTWVVLGGLVVRRRLWRGSHSQAIGS